MAGNSNLHDSARNKQDEFYTQLSLIESELKYQEELRKRMVLSSMGTQVIGGLTGNITLVKGKPVSASWEQENSAVAAQKKAFTSESISPKRLAMQMGISKQLLIQSSLDVERMVMNDILAAHSEALEDAAVNGDGSSNKPTGILNVSGTKTVELGVDGKIPTFADMVQMETELASLNADLGRLAYLTNPKVRGLFKTTLMSAGVGGYVWQNNEVNGFPAYASNFVPSNLTKGSASEKCSAMHVRTRDFGEISEKRIPLSSSRKRINSWYRCASFDTLLLS